MGLDGENTHLLVALVSILYLILILVPVKCRLHSLKFKLRHMIIFMVLFWDTVFRRESAVAVVKLKRV